MSIKKQFLKSRPVCKTTFRVKKEKAEALNAESIYLVGDFNDWDETATPMAHLKKGDFKAILDLTIDDEHAFRYLVNGETWVNEEDADKTVPTEYPGAENSVIVT
jgi:1,4-alpha-glucan branching enzyme